MADDWVLCLGAPHATARQALEHGCGPDLSLVYYEDAAKHDRPALLAAAPAILCWSAKVTAGMLRTAARTKIVQKIGEGMDKIDLDAAKVAGIQVAKTAGVNATSSAELTMLLILAALRRLPAAHTSMMDGRWGKWEVRAGTQELRGKQLGVIGLGKIGQLVAARARAFEASIVYHNRRPLPPDQEAAIGARYAPLDDLLIKSDIVTVHVPLNASTMDLIGKREIGLMKRSAVLINTSRGGIVNESDLAAALAQRRIFAAGLDVYREEPPSPCLPFRSLDNVILTPHMAGVTDDSRAMLIRHAFRNIRLALSGQALDPEDVMSPPGRPS